ncbi:hypothetical protein OIO90_005904 [Microbotryomycetes sp. JL221]|nr:hypothetical protein OIO90_005904 [Microbotryomycetes sp. JL221]
MSSSSSDPSPNGASASTSHESLLTKFKSMETSKKYTLVFLLSVGTTLLVTGASGSRLLKRAKQTEASSSSSSSSSLASTSRLSPSTVNPASVPSMTTERRTRRQRNDAVAITPPLPIPKSIMLQHKLPQPPTPVFADPLSIKPKRRGSLLQSWKPQSSIPFESSSSSSTTVTAYFLPNSTISNQSNEFAKALDESDKLHEHGIESIERQKQIDNQPLVDEDDFNPAMYAMKAFVIATVITVSSFALGITGLMKFYEVQDFESLALALSHSVPNKIENHRPTIPSWIKPKDKDQFDKSTTTTTTTTKDDEKESEEEELSYWSSLKETLDREAFEMKLQRQKAWNELKSSQQNQKTTE